MRREESKKKKKRNRKINRSENQLKYKSKQLSLNRHKINRKISVRKTSLPADENKLDAEYELTQGMLESAEKDCTY